MARIAERIGVSVLCCLFGAVFGKSSVEFEKYFSSLGEVEWVFFVDAGGVCQRPILTQLTGARPMSLIKKKKRLEPW